MSEIEDLSQKPLIQLRRYAWFIAVVWAVVIIAMTVLGAFHIRENARLLARNEALVHFKWIKVFRSWVASHGGVYVPANERTPPNQYLKIEERDISTPTGRPLTLMNPAYMTRQLYTEYGAEVGVVGHITSLKLLNPDNAPDPWERAALEEFDRGLDEKMELSNINGDPYLRLIRALAVEKPCLKCHENQGYKVGDVRGGISVSIPMKQYQLYERNELSFHVLIHGVIWLLGLSGLGLGVSRLRRQIMEGADVTAALHQSEEQQRLILDHMAEGIFGLDANGKCTFANSSCLKLFGYDDVNDLLGKNMHNLIHHTRADGIPYPEDECKILQAYREGRGTHVDDEVMWRADGSSFPAAYWSYPIVKEGEIIGLVVNFFDITERKRAGEERARLFRAIEHSAETILITDTEGAITYVNPAFEKVTGYTKEEVIGRNPRILKSGKHDPAFYKNLWDTITGGKVWSGRIINKRKDGSLYEEDTTISPVVDSHGRIDSYVAVRRDVTREAQLSKARDYFTSVTSHELRTPLTKLGLVKMLLRNLLKKHPDSSEVSEVIDVLDNSIADFDRIISAAEMFTDLILARGRRAFRLFNLNLLLQFGVLRARENMGKESRDIDLLVNIEDLDREAWVICNQEMAQKAIDEILSNAIKYTPDGGTVRVSSRSDDGGRIVEIHDDGIGIDLQKQELVFEPFFSLEDHNKHSTSKYLFLGGGIGMGLTLSRLILEHHNGSLELYSEGENRGTTITMRFPLD